MALVESTTRIDRTRYRILYIITGLNIGGAEVMLLKLLGGMEKELVSVISLTSIGEVGRKMQSMGINVEMMCIGPSWNGLRAFFRLVRRIGEIKPDLVHTWMFHADVIGGLAARIAGVPSVVWGLRSSDFISSETRFSTHFIVWLWVRLSSIVPSLIQSCSDGGRIALVRRGARKGEIIVIPNGVSLEVFSPNIQARSEVRSELGVCPSTLLIGMFARFHEMKNHRGFIEAAGFLSKSRPGVHFVLAGRGVTWDNADLAGPIADAGMEDCFHLLGERQDIPRLTAALDLATLTSWSGEGFPNVLIEAMACGVPCVATDVGDARFIVGDAGWIVGQGDMHLISKKWEEYFSLTLEEKEQLRTKARERVETNFDLSNITNLYREMYWSLYSAQRMTGLSEMDQRARED